MPIEKRLEFVVRRISLVVDTERAKRFASVTAGIVWPASERGGLQISSGLHARIKRPTGL